MSGTHQIVKWFFSTFREKIATTAIKCWYTHISWILLSVASAILLPISLFTHASIIGVRCVVILISLYGLFKFLEIKEMSHDYIVL